MTGLRVLFLVPHALDCAPSQRYRFEQWLRLLPPNSVQADVRPFWDADAYSMLYSAGGSLAKARRLAGGLASRLRDLIGRAQYDVVYVHREALPLGSAVMEALWSRRTPLVYDFDDALYVRRSSDANRAVQWLKRPSKVSDIISKASVTLTSNRHLAGFAEQFCDDVRVVPPTVDTDRWIPIERRSSREPVRLGWSGSATTAEDLRTIDQSVRELLSDPGFELTIIGPHADLLAGCPRVRRVPWTSASEIPLLQSLDIGLMPLADDEWTRGKSAMKALLYMATGSVAVVSPVGAAADLISDHVNGRWATSPEEWVAVVQELGANPDRRRELAMAGRATVERDFSGRRWAPEFLHALEAAAASPRH